MNYEQLRDSVQEIVGKTITDKLASQIIQQTPDGFNVFNQFMLSESNGEWNVNDLVFSSSKIALTWCIYTSQGKHKAANKLRDLDCKLYSKQFDIDILLSKLEKRDDAILQARLTEDIEFRRKLRKEITVLMRNS